MQPEPSLLMKSSLSGKTILITRSAQQADDMAELVRSRGGVPVVVPTIDIIPPVTWDAADRAAAGLHMYDGLIFTSANGVRFFLDRLVQAGISPAGLSRKMICCVGGSTREAIESYGLTVTAMPARFTAGDLAAALGYARRLEQLAPGDRDAALLAA